MFLSYSNVNAQNTQKKVILQAFWWDYTNNSYVNSWANYLTELAPRIKAMGIDAVWIPPSYKNTGTNSVGYSPFDHYDLGDKFQKGNTTTRVGTKDELLRMIAVFHAHGIEVIQDVVLNHVDGAGASNGAGGQDSSSFSQLSNGGFKNFRYTSFATPASSNPTAEEYWSRSGRWSKNYSNFHPHVGHNAQNDDWTEPFWGPDFCYGYSEDGTGNGFGTSSNATCAICHNPNQASNYNRDQAREWFKWFVKQTDVDGFRWDAVKHFPPFVVQDLSYNVKYLNGWANKGETMLNFGEYVGGGATLDNYVNDVASSNSGSEKLIGTKDFGLRGAFYSIVAGNGGYDMAQVPGSQQNERVTYYGNTNTYANITVPFVNNHDTYRPQVNSDGDIIGWNTNDELAPHIDPNDPRLSVIYALTFAVDGNPLIFFEDLFNINNTGKRFSHDPKNTIDLPQNTAIENIIWAHQNLDFKSGPYKVRGHSGNTNDHLIIERGGKAIISTNDNWTNWQTDWVDSDFPAGTVLKDYGNSSTGTTVVQNDQRVQISTPPCDGSANRRGYAIWAPVGQDANTYAPPRNPRTSQEWEMADDLGDSHCSSLGQGGRLPNNSTESRTVGKVFSAANKKIDIEVYGENNTNSITLSIHDLDGNELHLVSGTSPLITDFMPTTDDFYTIKINNTTANYNGQKCWVKIIYTAPLVVNTAEKTPRIRAATWTGRVSDEWLNCQNWQEGLRPSPFRDVIIKNNAPNMPRISANTFSQDLMVENGATLTIEEAISLRVTGDLVINGQIDGCGMVRIVDSNIGDNLKTLDGNLDFCNLGINHNGTIQLNNNTTVEKLLELKKGKVILNNYSLTVEDGGQISEMNAASYLVTNNESIATSYLIQTISTDQKIFPVGTEDSYTPLYLTNEEGVSQIKVRTFDQVYQLGDQGILVDKIDSTVNKTWEVVTETGLLQPIVELQWNEANENIHFNRSGAILMSYNNGVWSKENASLAVENPPFKIISTDYIANARFFSVWSSNNGITNSSDSTGLKIYPNPTNGQITLEINDGFDAQNDQVEVRIYTIDGKLAYQTSGLLEQVNNDLNNKFPTFSSAIFIFDIRYKEEQKQVKVWKKL
jgi:alpha-amylase